MFIKKKEYERLKEARIKLFDADVRIAELKARLKESESKLHRCNDLCKGCQHLIESKELNFTPFSSVSGIREMTTRRCALDRTCKDFKAKETNNE